mgnify:CR=1 FL=1
MDKFNQYKQGMHIETACFATKGKDVILDIASSLTMERWHRCISLAEFNEIFVT